MSEADENELYVLFGKEHLNVRAGGNIANLKRRIEEQTGVFVRRQKIIYKGKVDILVLQLLCLGKTRTSCF